MSEQKDKDPIRLLAEKIERTLHECWIVIDGRPTVADVIESILRREGVRVDVEGLRPGRMVGVKCGMRATPLIASLVGWKSNGEAVVEFRGTLLCYERSKIAPLPDAAEKGEEPHDH